VPKKPVSKGFFIAILTCEIEMTEVLIAISRTKIAILIS